MVDDPGVGRPHYSRQFVTGTTSQRTRFDAALAAASFPWFRLGIPVHVYFTDDPAPTEHFEVAWTTYFANTNVTLNTFSNEHAEVRIANGLLDPQHAFYQGIEFFNEVVVHEMAHVLIAQLDPGMADDICGMFGAPASAWNPAVTDHESWKNRVIESFAETFKDLYLPRASRKYDNRTNWRLQQGRIGDFYDVLETVYDTQLTVADWVQTENLGMPFTDTDGKDYVAVSMALPGPIGGVNAIAQRPAIGDFLAVIDHRLERGGAFPGTDIPSADPADFALSDWDIQFVIVDGSTGTVHTLINEHNPGFELHTAHFSPAGNEGPPYTWYATAEGSMPYFTLDRGPYGIDSWDEVVVGSGASIWYIEKTPQPNLPRPAWPYPAAVVGAAPAPVGTIRRGYRG